MSGNKETLEILYKEKNIAEVLDLSIEEAISFFKEQPDICNTLSILDSLGLAYMKLGQSATTLSGGEIVAIGTPEEVMGVSSSYTGMYLKKWAYQ